ncbi:hypothetical protein NUW54_g4849 [Trametes sanguinea]|uniref:Uncharacterized protein n=1 Tax=Trametes sanguinea TaxID=158606 RepID=A0ACC1PYF5_9APHY|nr:hypothetical protein NUW54_g4849 [Trametes sanguinea]
MFHRERPEKEYAPLYQKYNIGTTVYSALASGLLTGKYNNGIPPDSRFAVHSDFFKERIAKLKGEEGQKQLKAVSELATFAEKELGCSINQLALAWVAINPNTSTVILGASKPEQVLDNLKALEVIPKLTPEVLEKIEKILDNKPSPYVVLAASICTKGGKAVISRQFRDMSRARIESLLASFPKLIPTGTQHTSVETSDVRYVYQPLEDLYILLITNKSSNILQDIDTLHLFARVVSDLCRSAEQREILKNEFELLSAFDEIVSLGYREPVNLMQVRNVLEMESHEEKIQEIIARNKEAEAKEELKRRAKQLEMQRREQQKPKKRMVITHDQYVTLQSLIVMHLSQVERETGRGVDRDELIDWYLELKEDEIQDVEELEYEKELITKMLRKLVKDNYLIEIRGDVQDSLPPSMEESSGQQSYDSQDGNVRVYYMVHPSVDIDETSSSMP